MSEQIETLISKLRDNVKAYNNFFAIMNKAEQDGYIKSFMLYLTDIFQKEFRYAVQELKKLKKKRERLDIRQLVENNIYIFKENLKIILLSGIEQVWSHMTQKQALDEMILKEVY